MLWPTACGAAVADLACTCGLQPAINQVEEEGGIAATATPLADEPVVDASAGSASTTIALDVDDGDVGTSTSLFSGFEDVGAFLGDEGRFDWNEWDRALGYGFLGL